MRDAGTAFWRSYNLHQLSSEIGEDLRTVGSEVDIVFDANSAPARPVNAGLDRHDRARAEYGLDSFSESWRFVDFEPETVTETVAERLAEAALFDIAASQAVSFLPLHARPN